MIRAGEGKSGGEQSGDLENAPRVRRIRTSVNGEATRVTIDLEGSVQYSSARISNPERIFFDLHSARLTGEVARGNVQVDGRLLTAVRVAQNQAGVVRVVLDVTGVKDYTASLSSNPPQLIIDLYGSAEWRCTGAQREVAARRGANAGPCTSARGRYAGEYRRRLRRRQIREARTLSLKIPMDRRPFETRGRLRI